MSLRATVQGAVNKAFIAVGDLVSYGTLSSTQATGYDFSTGTTTKVGPSDSVVEVILQTTQRDSGEGFSTTALLKSGPDLSVYDTITVEGVDYRITSFEDDTFVITAQLIRE